MGTHSGGRGARLHARVGFALLAVVLAGLATIVANVAPASALGSPVLLTITVSPTAASVPAGEAQQFTATGHYSDLSTQNLTDTVTWKTSSSTTATISNTTGSQGLATAVATGAATITATDGSISGVAAMTVLPAVLLTVAVSPAATSIPLGETAPFTAIGHYSDGSTQDLTKSVTWTTSDSSVATVSDATGTQGVVTAAGTGLATITATDPTTSIFGTSAVTVLPAVLIAVTISPPAANIPAGETQLFTATGVYSDTSTKNITDSVTWSSSDTSAATVSNASGSQGEVTAVATGASVITATDPTTSIDGTSAVTVLPAVLAAIEVSPLATSIPAGETQQYQATGVYSDGSTRNLTDSVTWSSSDTSAATVSNASGSPGLATAVADGATTITATDPATSIFGTAALTVLLAVLVAITVTPPAASVPAGDTQQMTATGLYSDGTTQNITDSVTWASSDTGVAKVSNKTGDQGVVTGVATGVASITATDPTTSIEGIAGVTVLPAVLLSISVSPVAADVPAGETQKFTATGLYSDGSTEDLTDSVTWSSSTSDATVSNSAGSQGVVTGVTDGASTITATDPATSIFGTALVTVLPAVLVGITVTPAEASVAQYGTQQFTATGLYSDLSTENITNSVTWSSSDYGEAGISNITGSQGLANGLAPGDVVITATDPTTGIPGTAALDVTGPAITLTPSSGGAGKKVVVVGKGFTPGSTIVVHYLTRESTSPRFLICRATVGTKGTFRCKGKIRNSAKTETPGPHKVNAKVLHGHGTLASAVYTLT